MNNAPGGNKPGQIRNPQVAPIQRTAKTDPVAMFLTPESMLTPGVVGALVMMITNALANNFHISRPHTGLLFSLVCGLLVLVAENQIWKKCIYYVLNSLVIFCVAVGSGTVATADQHVSIPSFIGIAQADENHSFTDYINCIQNAINNNRGKNLNEEDASKLVAICSNSTIKTTKGETESITRDKASPWDPSNLSFGRNRCSFLINPLGKGCGL